MATIMHCAELSSTIKVSLAQRIHKTHKRYMDIKHPWPRVVIVTASEEDAVQRYLRNKIKDFKEVGIRYVVLKYSDPASPDDAISAIRQANQDNSINGIMVQLPFSTTVDVNHIIDAIDPSKDVDGLTSLNTGYLWKGHPHFYPCTPRGIVEILKNWGIDPTGRSVCVIGRSNIVGKPMVGMLVNAGAMVTVCHSKIPREDIIEQMKRSEIIISAIGQPNYWTPDDFTPGATLIDVGINMVNGKLCGDFAPECVDTAGLITPVPGGVGLMTRAMLCQNIVDAWSTQNDFVIV